MEIVVRQGDWQVPIIATSGVSVTFLLETVRDQILPLFDSPPLDRISVERNANGPQVLFRPNCQGDYTVQLNSDPGGYWCQMAFQFAHELCHILSDHERLRPSRHHWFHETLCEIASLFCLHKMPIDPWYTAPGSFGTYADDMCTEASSMFPFYPSVSQWVVQNQNLLDRNPKCRELNRAIAIYLLPEFQGDPKSWNSTAYLPVSQGSFEEYVNEWHVGAPPAQDDFIRRIASIFGVTIPS